jgi:hypothetical protein
MGKIRIILRGKFNNTPDGGQARIEARTTGGYQCVGKVTRQGAFWKERRMKIGDDVWWLNKQTDGRYLGNLGNVLVKGNFYHKMPLEVWVKGSSLSESRGKVFATKAQ